MGAGYVGILSAELHFPENGSLKGKRKYVKSARAQLHERFGAAVAEVDHHDLWQRTTIAVSAVAGQGYHVRKVMQQVEKYVGTWPRVEIIDSELSLHYPDE